MSFDWTDYLALSKQMFQSGQSDPDLEEAFYRAAISRCYYAAFCAMRNFLRDEEDFTPYQTGRDHRAVPDFVRSQSTRFSQRQRQKIYLWLDRLRDNRNSADYDDTVLQLRPLAQSSLAMSQNIFDELDTVT